MDEFLMSPDFDTWENNAGILHEGVDAREEFWIAPENVENYVSNRSYGGMA